MTHRDSIDNMILCQGKNENLISAQLRVSAELVTRRNVELETNEQDLPVLVTEESMRRHVVLLMLVAD